ncbi:MAG: hypothetical protein ABI620_04660, partial [Chloroflexota bacterium]
MQFTPLREQTWFRPAIVLAAVLALAIAGLTMFGGQVSGILSTVGSSISGPGYPQGDTGGDGDVSGGSDGSGGVSGGGSEPGGVVTA